ncbi:MAG: SIMPL domain-containing protein [Chitinophagales bacterium]
MDETRNKNIAWALIALILALGLIISSSFISNGLVKFKSSENTITVTGSAKQQIKSDQIVWNGSFSVQTGDLKTAYAELQNSQRKVNTYLVSKGISQEDIVFSSITTTTNYAMLPNGQYSNKIEGYCLSQQVEVRTKDVEGVTQLSREATELINDGVEFQSNAPQYYYTKIADLKVKMLSLATKDAMKRAEEIAKNTNSSVGGLRNAKMGVIQITPLYSNEISDYGMNDTSSLEKEITGVVSCTFEIKD